MSYQAIWAEQDMQAEPEDEYPISRPSAMRRGNRTMLAVQAARTVRARHDARFHIHTALQSQAGPSLTLHGTPPPRATSRYQEQQPRVGSFQPSLIASPVIQPLLPGCE